MKREGFIMAPILSVYNNGRCPQCKGNGLSRSEDGFVCLYCGCIVYATKPLGLVFGRSDVVIPKMR